MKLQIFVLGGLLCLGATAPAQTSNQDAKSKSTQSANRMKRAPATAGQTVTGCVDQQDGHYVLRDAQSDQLIRLQPAGIDADNDFARFVGHQAQASGTLSSGVLTVTHIGQVADMCPIGK
jgi:hypothetical protein